MQDVCLVLDVMEPRKYVEKKKNILVIVDENFVQYFEVGLI